MNEDTSFKRGVNYLQLSKKYASLLILLYLTPVVFLFLGYVVTHSPNERPHLIERYGSFCSVTVATTNERRPGSLSERSLIRSRFTRTRPG